MLIRWTTCQVQFAARKEGSERSLYNYQISYWLIWFLSCILLGLSKSKVTKSSYNLLCVSRTYKIVVISQHKKSKTVIQLSQHILNHLHGLFIYMNLMRHFLTWTKFVPMISCFWDIPKMTVICVSIITKMKETKMFQSSSCP